MIDKVYEIIEENYKDSNICIASIANTLGVTENYLGRRFVQITGESISRLIVKRRLTEAARLLIETDEKIKKIMHMVGYSNSSHFSALFKKFYGVTPSVYRENIKKLSALEKRQGK